MIKDLENEVWKDIPGYEGLYQVSNLGRVKSLDRIINSCYNSVSFIKGKLLKPRKSKYGYLQIKLSNNSKQKRCYVHRLVAETFLLNPNNLPCINHKDENKTNNCVNNLEFCTHTYNMTYSFGKSIKCFDLKTKEITYYSSIREAGRQMNINMCCIWQNIYNYKSPYKKRYIFSKV